jgi:Arc/MetJ family transcription regulator
MLLCEAMYMTTNIDIDERLLEEARALGPFRTKKAIVNEALAEYVRVRKQRRILEMVGKVDYYPDYDYKAMRRQP